MLDIQKTREDSKLDIVLVGRLDTTTAPELEASIKESIDGVTDLCMDFEQLEYISSAGLRVLLSTQKAMNAAGGTMQVAKPNEAITEIFQVTGFVDILTIV
ncbi:MAG: STAS domain-containing protein [Mogibacterium sp.]|nr:STAS domain-containing protein [Mogibacterium sp.]